VCNIELIPIFLKERKKDEIYNRILEEKLRQREMK